MIRLPKWPIAGEREIELLRTVLESSQWGGFNEIVRKFEDDFAAFQHTVHGIAAANGTVTLECMAESCGIGRGDEVIIPAISFISTASAISRVGATPVFVDIEERSFQMDPERTAAAVTPRTKAILAVHFGGPMADMDALAAIAREHGLLLLEDCAHAHGSEWDGRRAGSIGRAGSFSFQNGKTMTAGEGGLITTNDGSLAAAMRSRINQGRREGANFFCHFTLGTNYRITALQTAVLLAQLERLPGQIEQRRRNEIIMREALEGICGLQFQTVPSCASIHSHYLLVGRLPVGRDKFHQGLTAAGIPCTPFYPHVLYENPMYKQLPAAVTPCPVAEQSVRNAFWLPHRVLLADNDTFDEIVKMTREALLAAVGRD